MNTPYRPFAHIEGVTYPDQKPTPPRAKDSKRKGYITVKEAAKILGSSESAARIYMKRHRVKNVKCATPKSPPVVYWQEATILALAEKRKPTPQPSNEHISVPESVKLTGRGRNTIRRAVESGQLTAIHMRVPSPQGMRNRLYLLKAEVQRLFANDINVATKTQTAQ